MARHRQSFCRSVHEMVSRYNFSLASVNITEDIYLFNMWVGDLALVFRELALAHFSIGSFVFLLLFTIYA